MGANGSRGKSILLKYSVNEISELVHESPDPLSTVGPIVLDERDVHTEPGGDFSAQTSDRKAVSYEPTGPRSGFLVGP